MCLTPEGETSSANRWGKRDAPGDDVLRLRSVIVRSASQEQNYFPLEEDLFVDIEYEVLQVHPLICVSIHLHTEGVCAFVGGNASSPTEPGIFRASCRIPQNLLNNNLYYLTVFLITNTTELRVIQRDAISFFSRGVRSAWQVCRAGYWIGSPRLE